jgi:hypothetical protein
MNPFIKLVTFLLLLLATTEVFSQTFYDKNGNAILYYNATNKTVFDYSGNPKFYFKFDNNQISLYDFEGKHLAWLSDGILRDHEGRILASQKGRITNITYNIEPIKPVEKVIPIKRVEQVPPIQPVFINEFSKTGLTYSSNSTATSTPMYLQNDYVAVSTFKPYQLPADDIFNALRALNAREQQMLARGYVYDSETDNYIKKEEYIRKQELKAEYQRQRARITAQYIQNLVAEAENTPLPPNVSKLNGWYNITATQQIVGGVKTYTLCKIKKGRVVQIVGLFDGWKYRFKTNIPIYNRVQSFYVTHKPNIFHRSIYNKIDMEGFLFFSLGITPKK